MAIRAKQLRAGTFDATAAGRAPFGTGLFDSATAADVFAAGALPGSKIAAASITAAELAASVAGNGLTGGAGTSLTIDPDTASGGDIVPVSVGVNGVGLDVSSLAGTGLEADGAGNLRIAATAAGSGLTGGGGSALSVGAGAGIAVSAASVAIDTTSTVTFVDDPATAWTFPVGTSGQGLFCVGTPVDPNHVPNKAYVDNAIAGLTWKAPVHVRELVGSAAASAIEALAPTAGDAYVVSTADGAGALATANVGDIWEYSGTTWALIIAGSGGFVSANARALASVQTPLNGTIGLVDGTDDGKILSWDGTSLTPTKTTPSDGWAVLVTDQDNDGDSIFANLGYNYQGVVPTGSWIQFTGAATVNAGLGLTKSGNTIDVGAGNGISVAADSIAVQADSLTGGNVAAVSVTSNGVGLDVSTIAGTGLEADGAGNLRLGAQGTGIGGGGGTTLSFDATAVDGDGLLGTGSVLDVAAATAALAQKYGGLVVNRTSDGASAAAAGLGYLAIATDDSTLQISPANEIRVKALGITESHLAASVAGDGLTGGAGSPLAVGAGAGISVTANSIAVLPSALISGGAAQIDGDQLDITFTPANYTPDTGPAEVTSTQHLTAHLKGIDNAIASAGGTPRQEPVTSQNITGSDVTLTDTLNNTPTSAESVKLYLNGVLLEQGVGKDYTVSGTAITILAGTGTAPDLDTLDKLIAVYES